MLDIYCHKAQYRPADEVILFVEYDGTHSVKTCVVQHLQNNVYRTDVTCKPGVFKVSLGAYPPGGYAVSLGSAFTAFDVSEKSSDMIRYGFLSHFTTEDIDDDDDLRQMLKYHITAVQFYDWMYRHHQLLPPAEIFTDALDREVDLGAVKAKITGCHKYGMQSIAYGAVYGAEREYSAHHPEQLLYKNSGEKHDFIDLIDLCNISPENPWSAHIVEEFVEVVKTLDFDGIHMDQYGFPKFALDYAGKPVDMEGSFRALIDRTKERISQAKEENILFFNCVNNWPVAEVAHSFQDAVYIEVWDPHSDYHHLKELITRARDLSSGKNVILAAYIYPFHEPVSGSSVCTASSSDKSGLPRSIEEQEYAALFTMAVIYSSGGGHLLLGEQNGILTEGYYVNHGRYADDFVPVLRSYQDFIVKYRDLLYDASLKDYTMTFAGGINTELALPDTSISTDFQAGTVGIQVFRAPKTMVLHLINLTGMQNNRWNAPKQKPPILHNTVVNALVYGDIQGVYVASPDSQQGALLRLNFQYVSHEQGQCIQFIIPELRVWSMVYIAYTQG